MARPRKDGKYINFYMASDVFSALERFSEEHGMTKTMVIERALKQYIEASNGYTIRDGVQRPNVSFEEYLNK